ncbi:MAG: DUF167 domain-containing protein [Pyrinomonadaceae bacterium]
MPIDFSEQNDAVSFSVRVIPRSSKSEIAGEHDGSLKVRISAPPVDGAANAEIVRLFAKLLGVSKSSVEIVSGETSKNKRIRVSGLTATQFTERIKMKPNRSELRGVDTA